MLQSLRPKCNSDFFSVTGMRLALASIFQVLRDWLCDSAFKSTGDVWNWQEAIEQSGGRQFHIHRRSLATCRQGDGEVGTVKAGVLFC